MKAFERIENAYTVVRTSGGLFKQLDVFTYQGGLYAKNGAGYVQLNFNKTTSNEKVRWREIVNVDIKEGRFGVISV
tara:strand:+ start:5856 stop:6083 length:228 start_codon:yes stop_codon:yes gene_type:complete